VALHHFKSNFACTRWALLATLLGFLLAGCTSRAEREMITLKWDPQARLQSWQIGRGGVCL